MGNFQSGLLILHIDAIIIDEICKKPIIYPIDKKIIEIKK